MFTENDIRERFSAKGAEFARRIQIVEARLKKARAAEKPDAEEITRLEEKLVQLRVNVRDCEAKVEDAANVAARRNQPHDFKSRGPGQKIAPKGIDSSEKVGKIGG